MILLSGNGEIYEDFTSHMMNSCAIQRPMMTNKEGLERSLARGRTHISVPGLFEIFPGHQISRERLEKR